MDIKAYIASGILEQFVLGDTSAEQSAEVLRLAAQHPEIQQELDAIEDALFRYAQSQSVQPSAQVKANLFNELGLEDNKSGNNAGRIVKMDAQSASSKSPMRYFAAASVVLLCASTAINIWLYNRWQNSETALVAANAEKQRFADNSAKAEASYKQLSEDYERRKEDMKIMSDPAMKPVAMKGLPYMPEADAMVYWNPKNADVYLKVKNLPDAPHEHQYQLWAIVDGKPVDAGVFDSKEALEGMMKMKSMTNAAAFAVTIEKKGGSPVPTMEKMVLMGPTS